jgi:hypothetical protein
VKSDTVMVTASARKKVLVAGDGDERQNTTTGVMVDPMSASDCAGAVQCSSRLTRARCRVIFSTDDRIIDH